MQHSHNHCGRVNRRAFLSDVGMGFTGLALGSMLAREGLAKDDAHAEAMTLNGNPTFAPKAKSVIWYFMLGGTSHLESFDPKPEVTKHAGKTIKESPYEAAVVGSPFYRKNVRDFAGTPRELMGTLYPLQIGFQKRGDWSNGACGSSRSTTTAGMLMPS